MDLYFGSHPVSNWCHSRTMLDELNGGKMKASEIIRMAHVWRWRLIFWIAVKTELSHSLEISRVFAWDWWPKILVRAFQIFRRNHSTHIQIHRRLLIVFVCASWYTTLLVKIVFNPNPKPNINWNFCDFISPNHLFLFSLFKSNVIRCCFFCFLHRVVLFSDFMDLIWFYMEPNS